MLASEERGPGYLSTLVHSQVYLRSAEELHRASRVEKSDLKRDHSPEATAEGSQGFFPVFSTASRDERGKKKKIQE